MTIDTYGVNPLAPDAPPRPTPRESVPPAHRRPEQALDYDGRRGELFGIVLRNTLLALLTLGVYRFWGKTRLRRYLWARLRLLGDRLEWTGTPMELFLGFLVALAVLVPIVVISGTIDFFLASHSVVMQIGLQAVYYAVVSFLIGIAIFRARRYQLTRTAWRGIHFGQSGSSVRYALLWIGYMLLTVATLGIARPVGDIGLQRYAMRHTWLGSVPFQFEGRARDLMGRWILCLVLVPITLGLSLVWYAALLTRYFAAHTRFASLGFALPVSFRDLARIFLPWYLVLAAVFGLLGTWVAVSGAAAGPAQTVPVVPIVLLVVLLVFVPALQIIMVTHRLLGLIAARLTIQGTAELERIVQQAQQAPRTGEGLADALDVGGGLEIGF